jgi:hypothetical protein
VPGRTDLELHDGRDVNSVAGVATRIAYTSSP